MKKNLKKNYLFALILVAIVIIAILLVNVTGLNGVFTGRAAQTTVIPASDELLAEANNMKLLAENEFAVVTTPMEQLRTEDETGGELGESEFENELEPFNDIIMLSDGSQLELDSEDGEGFVMVSGSDEMEIYVEDASNVNIRSYESPVLIEEEEGKVKNKVKRKFEEGEELIPVIIQMKLPYDTYFEKGQGRIKIIDKKTKFEYKAAKINALMEGKSKVKKNGDLKIIGAVAAEIDKKTMEKLDKSKDVKNVWFDEPVEIVLDNSVPYIGAEDVWHLIDPNGFPLTGYGTVIAVIDTGVDYTHEDLGGCFGPECKVIGGWDFVNNDADPMDDHFHGTHCAATAGGNGILKGVAPDAKIMAYKVLGSGGSGSSVNVIRAIEAATDPNGDGDTSDHVDVVSMSLGSSGCYPESAEAQAVEESTAAGVVHAIAAGNSGRSGKGTVGTPGCTYSAITVAAGCKPNSQDCEIAEFSSRGPEYFSNGTDLLKPDITAPGVNICAARLDEKRTSVCIDDKHIFISGTSMATPHIAGAAALMVQAYPSATPYEIKDLLKDTATDLGEEYDAQGAGLVNLTEAIPGVAHVTWTPFSWTVVANPTIKINEFRQTFSVQRVNQTIDQVEVVGDNQGQNGISFNFSKTILDLSDNKTDTFETILNVDNDYVPAGQYLLRILLVDNGETKGAIPVLLEVKSTITTNPLDEVDYGVDDPGVPIWISDTKEITIINMRNDVSQVVDITRPVFPAGIEMKGLPSQVTVPAGGSTKINTWLEVNNSQVPNGHYESNIVFSNSLNEHELNAKFSKFYVILLRDKDPNAEHWYMYIHDRTNKGYLIQEFGQEYVLYLNELGQTLDIMIEYYPWLGEKVEGLYPVYRSTIFKEGIVNDDPIEIVEYEKGEAKNEYVEDYVLWNGSDAAPIVFEQVIAQYRENTNAMSVRSYVSCGGCDYSTNYISDVSGDYSYRRYSQKLKDFTILGAFYTGRYFGYPHIIPFFFADVPSTGIYSDYTVRNSPDDFGVIKIQSDLNPRAGSMKPIVWQYEKLSSRLAIAKDQFEGRPSKQIIYSLKPNPPDGGPPLSIAVGWAFREEQGCTKDEPCPNIFYSPRFNPITKERQTQGYRTLPDIEDDTIYTGLGPSMWTGKFVNTENKIILKDYFGFFLLMRQDYAVQEHGRFSYGVYKDGQLYEEGELPGVIIHSITWRDWDYTFAETNATAGEYEWQATVDYIIDNENMTGDVVSVFDTSRADPNPPAITRLYFYSGQERSQFYDPDFVGKLKFEFDPVGMGIPDSISAVEAYYSVDGINFIPLTVSNVDGIYNVDIQTGLAVPGEEIWFRIKGVDVSNNSLQYTFQVPVGKQPKTAVLTVSHDGIGNIVGEGIGCGWNLGEGGKYCQASYDLGSETTLTANPGNGWEFEGWEGACAGENTRICTLTMDGHKEVRAVFAPKSATHGTVFVWKICPNEGKGTIVSYPEGINCGPECEREYSYFPDGSTVTLTATAQEGSIFKGWKPTSQYNICNGTGDCTFTINISRMKTSIIYAKFDNLSETPTGKISICILENGSYYCGNGGGVVTSEPARIHCDTSCPKGSECRKCDACFGVGTNVTLTARALPGWEFLRWGQRYPPWSGNRCTSTASPSCWFYIESEDKGYQGTAVFIRSNVTFHELSVSKNGTGTGLVTSDPAGINCGPTCSAEFEEGTVLSLTPTPDSGSEFAGWSGDCSGMGSCIVNMTSSKSVTATFTRVGLVNYTLTVTKTGTGTGLVTSDPDGIYCGTTCVALFVEGTNVTLIPTPDQGSEFAGWSGDCSGTGTCVVTMNSNKQVTAIFNKVVKPTYNLSVAKTGTGTGLVTSDPAGISCGDVCVASYEEGTYVTLTATPDSGSEFVEWGGDCSGTSSTCTVLMDSEKAVTAKFDKLPIPRYKVTVLKTGNGTGTVTSYPEGINCGPDCEEWFDEGTMVTFTATPDPNSKFVGWTGDCSGTGNCTLQIYKNMTITARFDKITKPTYTLTVTKAGNGTGLVTSSPSGINCGPTCSASFEEGTVVTLNATPDSGNKFTGWSGDCSGSGTCTITMNSNKQVTATFIKVPVKYELQVTKAGDGNGTVTSTPEGIGCGPTCSAEFLEGTEVLLIPEAEFGSKFDGWSGACTGMGTCVIIMDNHKQVTATFKEVPTQQPNPPTNLEAKGISKTQIKLTWQDNSKHEFEFRIERATTLGKKGKKGKGGQADWQQIGKVGQDETVYIDTAPDRKTYYYRVYAVNIVGPSDYSNIASGRVCRRC